MSPDGCRVEIVVDLSHWKATVHYVDCSGYRSSQHRRLPLPRTIKVRLCLRCRPSEEDVRAAPPEVSWYAWSHAPVRSVRIGMEEAERISARQSMGHGRTLAHRTGWS